MPPLPRTLRLRVWALVGALCSSLIVVASPPSAAAVTPQFELTVTITGRGYTGVVSTPAGLACTKRDGTQVCSAMFDQGTVVTLDVDPSETGNITNVTGCSDVGLPCDVTINANTAVSMRSDHKYHATNNISPLIASEINYGDAVPLNIGASMTPGTPTPFKVTLPAAGLRFVSATPESRCTAQPDGSAICEPGLVMDGAVTWVRATMARTGLSDETYRPQLSFDEGSANPSFSGSIGLRASPQMPLMITTAGTGAGSVQRSLEGRPCEVSSACAATYPAGTTVTLTATASAGSQFAGFSGAGCSGSPCTVSVADLTAVTATFAADPPPAPLTLSTTAPRAVVATSPAASLRTRCTISRAALRRCRVVATDAAGNRVGSGEISATGDRRSGVVNVVLSRTALDRAGLRSRVLQVTLTAEGTASGSREVAQSSRSILVVPPVLRLGFAPNSAALTSSSAAAVRRVASTLGRAKGVECSGYVSTLLPVPTPFGETLAGRRSAAVCSALRGAGMKARYTVRNRGADRTIRGNDTPRGRALNRRVELRITL